VQIGRSRGDALAADSRAGTAARRKARLAQRSYVRKNWLRLLTGYILLVAIVAIPAFLFEDRDFLRGLALGAALAGTAGLIVTTIVIETGTGPTMAGEYAEQWTAQELRSLLDHGYRLANHVDVDGRGDADHVLIGPGGLFVLETKWSASPWEPTDRFFAAPVAQVQARARSTWLQVKRYGVEDVTPVLVLWGKAAKELSEGPGVRRNEDTYVIAGDNLRRWLLARPRGVLTQEQVDVTYQAVSKIAARGDRTSAPVPPSVRLLYWRAVSTFGLASATFLAPLLLARFGLLAYLIGAVGLVLAGLFLTRRNRVLGLGTVAGAGGSLAVGLVAFAVAYATTCC
jgi:hypothetical protein